MTTKFRSIIAIAVTVMLAACQTPNTPIPPTSDSRMATVSAQQTAHAEANAAQTAIMEARATATPSPTPRVTPAATATPSPESINQFAWMPSVSDFSLPTGAVAQLGIGRLEVLSHSPSREFLVLNINENAYMVQAMTLRRMWSARRSGLVTWLADGKRVGIGSVLYDAVTGVELASLPVDAGQVA